MKRTNRITGVLAAASGAKPHAAFFAAALIRPASGHWRRWRELPAA